MQQKTDIVPELKKKIDNAYKDLIEHDEALSGLIEKIQKSGTWDDTQIYAGRIATHRSNAFLDNIKAEDLPNGQMYYNIANRIIPPALKSDYDQVAEICMSVQEQANEAARIGIKAQKPELNEDRIAGIVNRISSEPFDDVKWLLEAPIDNFLRSAVDDTVKANADFHYKSGLNPVIKRTTDGKCCDWCSKRAGTYPYKPDMDREVFRRHENCGCTVAYYPDANAKTGQDVWTKRWDVEGQKQNATKEEKELPTVDQLVHPELKSGEKGDFSLKDMGTALSEKKEQTQTKKFVKYLNEELPEGANEDAKSVYKHLAAATDQFSMPVGVKHGKNSAIEQRGFGSRLTNVDINVPRIPKGGQQGAINTWLHELMHFSDLALRESDEWGAKWFSDRNGKLQKAIEAAKKKKMSDEMRDYFSGLRKEGSKLHGELTSKYDALQYEAIKKYEDDPRKCVAELKKLDKKREEEYDKELRNRFNGGDAMSDIYSALTGDTNAYFGHSSSYWKSDPANTSKEIVAEFGTLSMVRPDLVELLRRDQPDLVSALEDNLKQMAKALNGGKDND